MQLAPKRGSSLPNYLDQTSDSDKEVWNLDRRRREKVIWKMFTENVVRESSKPCKLKKMQ